MYKIEVIAKNADGATSTPAITFGFTQWPEAIEQLMDRTRTAAAAAILILFLILAVNTAKHYQKK
ncbi:MAG: hypothetical protein NTY30_01885 [Candidatus Berkelbacteria bacterium]|nr:hypothetical protein [Candidatus Berkelbacteria bacterium]